MQLSVTTNFDIGEDAFPNVDHASKWHDRVRTLLNYAFVSSEGKMPPNPCKHLTVFMNWEPNLRSE